MKIYAYRFVQKGPRPLEQLLEKIVGLDLSERSFLGSDDIRLEHAAKQGKLWFADFASPRRSHGPGAMGSSEPLSDIKLGEGLKFGEDTGIVYDAETGYAAIQYNHHGPRHASIRRYLEAADVKFGGLADDERPERDRYGFSLGAVLKQDAYARIKKFGIYKTVEFTISMPGALGADLEAGSSLGSVLNAPLPEGVDTLTIAMHAAAGKGSPLESSGVEAIIDSIARLGNAVRTATVKGKARPEDVYEAVNLVKDRVGTEVNLTVGAALRLERQDRWDALKDTLQSWLNNGLLPHVQL
ncbi:hypothetical protein FMN50_13750 [Rhodobacterales bacterium]|nr:hypothetical protein FMN50_13750 [Rhodobacterales bacterium]